MPKGPKFRNSNAARHDLRMERLRLEGAHAREGILSREEREYLKYAIDKLTRLKFPKDKMGRITHYKGDLRE